MSALPPIADILRCIEHVCFVPEAHMTIRRRVTTCDPERTLGGAGVTPQQQQQPYGASSGTCAAASIGANPESLGSSAISSRGMGFERWKAFQPLEVASRSREEAPLVVDTALDTSGSMEAA
jgi:hypothetical protein